MKQQIKRVLLLFSLLGLLLAACSGASPTVETPVVTQESTVVEQEISLATEAPVYPAEIALPTEAPMEAYPMAEVAPVESAYLAPDQAYAGPESAYIPPARAEEPAAAVPTQAVAPTVVATRQPRVDFVATDPASVQLAAGEVQLVEFFAFWCGTCKAMAPIVHGLEDEYQDRMNFVYLDIDDPATSTFKKQLGYRVQPHFFLLDKNGSILKQWLGRVSEEDLRASIEAALKP